MPWGPIPEAFARSTERELRKEVPSNHLLYDRCWTARAIARRFDCDDVAFELDDGFAVVHLTWSHRPEPLPFFHAAIYDTFAALHAQMVRDYEAWV